MVVHVVSKYLVSGRRRFSSPNPHQIPKTHANPTQPNPNPRIRYAATDDPRHPTGAFIAYRHLLEDLGEGARGSPGGCLAVGHREGEGKDPRFKGGGGSSSGGNDWGDADGSYGGGGSSSSSVGGGAGSCGSTSVAASRVFGKPTGLSRVRALCSVYCVLWFGVYYIIVGVVVGE